MDPRDLKIEFLEKEFEELRTKVALLEKFILNSNGGHHNTNYNTTQNGNNNIQENVTININNFCQDDNSFLTLDDVMEIATKNISDIMLEYVRKVNCNPEHKENQNFRISDSDAQVYLDGLWTPKNKQEALNSFHERKIKELVDLNHSPMTTTLPKGMKQRLEFVAEDDDADAKKRVRRDIEKLISRNIN
jgi:hypothetical protein